MARKSIAAPFMVWLLLILQFLPLVLFPPKSFSPASQEWWLPVLCALLAVTACLQLIIRRGTQLWPWYVLSFAHGINIISRLMMLWGHATKTVGGVTVLNLPYIALTLAAMAMSAWLLWYLELPEVRQGLLTD